MANKPKPDLEWAVVGTLAWFSLLGRAVSRDDLVRLLLKRTAAPADIDRVVRQLGDRVVEHDGLLSLADHRVSYPDEQSRRWYDHKWRRTHWAVRLLRWVPYVRMVAVANTLADRTASERSDIDVFIIIEHGRLYLGRSLVTGILQLAGLRRHGRKIANRICLSFFATTNYRDLQSIAFQPYDIYLAYWINELVPVLDNADTYRQFLRANQWVAGFLPRYGQTTREPARRPARPVRIVEWLLDRTVAVIVERRLARWQRGRIAKRPPNPDPDVRIIADDDMLKFHEKERRRIYRDHWADEMRRRGYDPDLITATG